MSITMVHVNPLLIEGDHLKVDRKFHVGMQNYAKYIGHPITSVNPLLRPGQVIMDPIEVPISELPYGVLALETDASYRLLPPAIERMRAQIAHSDLVYGTGLSSERIARRLGVPYIMVLEYDLQTQITVSICDIASRLRRAVRTGRCVWRYLTECLAHLRRAHSIHCNGYPIYDAIRGRNQNRLLYLDSRMSADMVIAQEELTSRLNSRMRRPLKLLYSGRYERLKGADDAVLAAAECLRRGLDIEMHCYGQGNLRNRMQVIASEFPDRIHIHEAVPYPELVKITRSFDLFVCCHIQNDPSCTYLEAFGAGLPIVGYANRMWKRLCEVSGGGVSSPLGNTRLVADGIEGVANSDQLLRSLSEKALGFATDHCFETEFKKRVDAIRVAIANVSSADP